jgi:HlyD family secretion protein
MGERIEQQNAQERNKIRKEKMKKKAIIGTLLPPVIVGFVLGFASFNSSKNNNIEYKTEAVDIGDIQDLVITTGILTPVTLVEVGSQVSGIIENTYVDFNSSRDSRSNDSMGDMMRMLR